MIKVLKAAFVYFLSAWLIALPVYSYAETPKAKTNQYGDWAETQFQKAGSASATESGGVGQMNGHSINFNDFGGDDPTQPTVSELKSKANSNTSRSDLGKGQKDALMQNSGSGSPSLNAQAYKLTVDTTKRPKPDLTNDPFLQPSRDVIEGNNGWDTAFEDCSTQTVVKPADGSVHMPDLKQCSRVVPQSFSCELTRSLSVSRNTTPLSSVLSMEPRSKMRKCGEDCYEVFYKDTVGTSNGGRVAVKYTIRDFTKIKKVEIYQNLWITWFPYKLHYTPKWISQPRINNGTHYYYWNDHDSVGKWAGVRIYTQTLNRKKIKQGDWKGDQDCLDTAINNLNNPDAEYICDVDPLDTPSGCSQINGIKTCRTELGYSPLDSKLSRSCKRATVKIENGFYKGQMGCWTDPQGKEHCPTNDGGNLNKCAAYESDPSCSFKSSQCIEGAEATDGSCMAYTDTYDCGYEVSHETYVKEEVVTCPGDVSCMGDECLDRPNESSGDFARAASMLNAAQFMTTDMSCVDKDGQPIEAGTMPAGGTCKVFAGTPGECKEALGGAQDCCKTPDNITMGDYLMLIMQVPKMDAAIMTMEKTSLVKGGYQYLRDPLVKGWDTVTKPISSAAETTTGAVKKTWDSTVGNAKDWVAKKIGLYKEKAADTAAKAIGSTGESMGGGGAAAKPIEAKTKKEAENAMLKTAGNYLSAITSAYSAYVVSMMVIQAVWECEESEFELNAKRKLKNCTFVGSYCASDILGECVESRDAYCCYNSPLSRIIQEQAALQSGHDFGTAKNPSCPGINIEDLDDIDWDKVDFSEWTAILAENGYMQTPGNIDIEALTGAGTALDIEGGDRKNAQDRLDARMEDVDIDQKRKDSVNTLNLDFGESGAGVQP